MRIAPTSAAAISATVAFAVARDAIVTTERLSAITRAFRVRGAFAAKPRCGARAAAGSRAPDWNTHAICAFEAATTMSSAAARAPVIAAAIQRPIAGNAVVITIHGAARLAALCRCRALPTQANRTTGAWISRRSACSANANCAPESAAAIGILSAATSVVTAAVERAIRIDPVRLTYRGATGLAALPTVGALRSDREPACLVVRTDAVYAVEATAAIGTVTDASARPTFISAAIEGSIVLIAVISADGGATSLRALVRGRALGSQCEPSGWGRSTGAPAACPVQAENTRATLDVRGTGAASVSTAVPCSIRRDAVTCTNHGATGLAALARRRAFGAKSAPARASAAAAASVGAHRTATTMKVRRASSACVTAAVELAVRNHSVVTANDRPTRLTAFGVCAESAALPTQGHRVLRVNGVDVAHSQPGRRESHCKCFEHSSTGSAIGGYPSQVVESMPFHSGVSLLQPTRTRGPRSPSFHMTRR